MSRVIRMLDREPGQRPATEIAGFLIENGIPPPPPRGQSNPVRVAMEALEVGQSFFHAGAKSHSTVHGVAKFIRGKTFRTAKTAEGVRVWRIT